MEGSSEVVEREREKERVCVYVCVKGKVQKNVKFATFF